MKTLLIGLLLSALASAATVLPGSYYDSYTSVFDLTTDTGFSATMYPDSSTLPSWFSNEGDAIDPRYDDGGSDVSIATHSGVPPDFGSDFYASIGYYFEGDPIPIPWGVYDAGTISYLELSGPFTFSGSFNNATDYAFNDGNPLLEFSGSGTAYFRIKAQRGATGNQLLETNVEMARYEFEAVPLVPTPEPGTWLLMVTGFGAIAALGRRRRNERWQTVCLLKMPRS